MVLFVGISNKEDSENEEERNLAETVPKKKRKKQAKRVIEEESLEAVPKRKRKKQQQQRVDNNELMDDSTNREKEENESIETVPNRRRKKKQVGNDDELVDDTTNREKEESMNKEENEYVETVPKRRRKKKQVNDDELVDMPTNREKEENESIETVPKRRRKKKQVDNDDELVDKPANREKEESMNKEENESVETVPKRRRKKQQQVDNNELMDESANREKEENESIETVPKRRRKKKQVGNDDELVDKPANREKEESVNKEENEYVETVPKRRRKKQQQQQQVDNNELVDESAIREKEENESIETVPKRRRKKKQMNDDELVDKPANREKEESMNKEENESIEAVPKRKEKIKKIPLIKTFDEDSYYDTSHNSNMINDDIIDEADEANETDETLNNDIYSMSDNFDALHSIGNKQNTEVGKNSIRLPENSIWNRIKIVETESPVQFLFSLRSQEITLTPQYNTSSYYYIYCTPQQHNEKDPNLEYLVVLAFHNGLQLYSVHSHKLIFIDSVELARVASVHCLVMSSYLEVYPPIKIYTPVDVVEEAPEIVISYKDRTANSFLYTVNSTIPCYLWCGAFRQGSPPPSVVELMRKPRQFMRSFIELEETGLTPDVAYKLYCYAESVHGSPMNTPVEDKYTWFTTKEGYSFCFLFIYSIHAYFQLDSDVVGTNLYNSFYS